MNFVNKWFNKYKEKIYIISVCFFDSINYNR